MWKSLKTGTGGLGNKRTRGDHPINSIVKIGPYTEKSPAGFKKFTVPQTIVKNHRQTQVADHNVELKESEKKIKYIVLARGSKKKKLLNMKVTIIQIVIGALGTVTNWPLDTLTGGLGNKRTSGDHRNDSIIEIGQNTEKSPGDLRKLAVTQTLVKDYQLTLMWKTQGSFLSTHKYRLCGDRDETINHVISECSKLAQRECKTRHDWVGKVINWEMCKKFKLDQTNK